MHDSLGAQTPAATPLLGLQVGALVAEDGSLLRHFFKSDPRRVPLWFGHFRCGVPLLVHRCSLHRGWGALLVLPCLLVSIGAPAPPCPAALVHCLPDF